MKNLNTKTLLAASVASLITFNTFAADDSDKDNETLVKFAHPQSITIDTPSDSASTAAGSISSTTWEIKSNNGVNVIFSGSSFDEAGKVTTTPQLAKQEVNASNQLIDNRYDLLTTTFGVSIAGSASVSGAATAWKGGSTDPTGTPVELVAGLGTATSTDSVSKHYGVIMPADATGAFTITLSTMGTGDVSSTQSGNYSTTVKTTVTANEQLGGI